ncbi:Hypothetical_protein [Hexamita inflata]|uniref:Hypothetical_protein n=1 Tax=Hexamita inflata TaxID=28002 RepID=A0AA86TQF1_9EUKA|nr:Hypothetical protein HINF_LOCUS12135 [Hexamita inflata]
MEELFEIHNQSNTSIYTNVKSKYDFQQVYDFAPVQQIENCEHIRKLQATALYYQDQCKRLCQIASSQDTQVLESQIKNLKGEKYEIQQKLDKLKVVYQDEHQKYKNKIMMFTQQQEFEQIKQKQLNQKLQEKEDENQRLKQIIDQQQSQFDQRLIQEQQRLIQQFTAELEIQQEATQKMRNETIQLNATIEQLNEAQSILQCENLNAQRMLEFQKQKYLDDIQQYRDQEAKKPLNKVILQTSMIAQTAQITKQVNSEKFLLIQLTDKHEKLQLQYNSQNQTIASLKQENRNLINQRAQLETELQQINNAQLYKTQIPKQNKSDLSENQLKHIIDQQKLEITKLRSQKQYIFEPIRNETNQEELKLAQLLEQEKNKSRFYQIKIEQMNKQIESMQMKLIKRK